ncbi:hypothetical protein [Lentzea sp. E54]
MNAAVDAYHLRAAALLCQHQPGDHVCRACGGAWPCATACTASHALEL